VRPVRMHRPGLLPEGARSVSVFLVNRRRPATGDEADAAFAFQAKLTVRADAPLVPRPNLRGLESDDWDENVADLQYRDVYEYAVGHGVATEIMLEKPGLTQKSHADPRDGTGLSQVFPRSPYKKDPDGCVNLLKNPGRASQTRKTTGTDPGLLCKPLGQSLSFAQFQSFIDFLNSSSVSVFSSTTRTDKGDTTGHGHRNP